MAKLPAPDHVLKLKGTFAKSKARRRATPRTDGRGIARPTWLPADSRKVWDTLIPMLAELGILHPVDEFVLCRYVVTFARWRLCSLYVDKHGLVDEDGHRRPQAAEASRLSDQLLRIEGCFGMSAASRAKLYLGGKDEAAAAASDYFPNEA